MTAVLLAIAVPVLAAVVAYAFAGIRPSRFRHLGVALTGILGAGIAFLCTWAVAAAALAGELPARMESYLHVPTGGLAFDIAFRLEPMTALMAALVTGVALAVQVYSSGYLRADPRYPRYVAFVSLFTAAMLLVVAADDLLVLLVGWEMMGICSYLLIGHEYRRAGARDGALKAFVVTRLGDIGFLFGIFVLGTAAGTFRISGVQQVVAEGGLDTGVATLATMLLLCGVVGKSAQFPLHIWLPDAMAGPTPVSALIHAATMVAAGVFLVARLFVVYEQAPFTLGVLAVIAAVTMLGSALAALAEDDVKRVLAWSTVSQLAYMFGGLAVGNYAVGLLHLLTHGAFKALLFLCAGVLIAIAGSNLASAMGGLRPAAPITFVTMTIGLLALVGLPPVSGFFSKEAVLSAAERAAVGDGPGPSWAGWVVLLAGLTTVAVTAAYATRLWLRVFFGPRKTGETVAAHERAAVPRSMRWTLPVLAIPSLLVGYAALAPKSLREWLSGGEYGGAFAGISIDPTTTVLSMTSAALGILAVWWIWRRTTAGTPIPNVLNSLRPVLASGFGVEAFYVRTIVAPARGAARMVVACDRDVVDGYVSGSGTGARALGALLRRVQAGNLQVYLGLLLTGVVIIAASMGASEW